MSESIYNFTVKDIKGADYPLDQLKGKKVMLVNTASACGLTPQYKGLQELYSKYGPDRFVDEIFLKIPFHLIITICLLYTSPSPRDQRGSRMPSSA